MKREQLTFLDYVWMVIIFAILGLIWIGIFKGLSLMMG